MYYRNDILLNYLKIREKKYILIDNILNTLKAQEKSFYILSPYRSVPIFLFSARTKPGRWRFRYN